MKEAFILITIVLVLIFTGVYMGTIAKKCEVCEIQPTAREKCERTFNKFNQETVEQCISLLRELEQ